MLKVYAPPQLQQHHLQWEDIGKTKYPLTDKWMKELWYLYTVGYSAIKDENLPFEITWIDPVKLVKKNQI